MAPSRHRPQGPRARPLGRLPAVLAPAGAHGPQRRGAPGVAPWPVGQRLVPNTTRAEGPGERTTGAFGQHGFDEVDGEHARHLPRRQDERGQGVGVFDRVQKTLHSWIIVAYAVVKAEHRASVSFGTLGEGIQKYTA